MKTIEKGDLAELKVITRAIEKGWKPSKPVVSGTRYDLLLDDGENIKKVQVKYSSQKLVDCEGTYVVELRRKNGDRSNTRKYNKTEIDVLIVYFPSCDKFCWFNPDVWEGKSQINVRLEPTKTGRESKALKAEDYVW
jgi:hypothetical protein